MRLLSVPILIAVLFTLPSAASAATFRGKTSQDRKSNLTVDGKGPKRLYLSYRAPCDSDKRVRFTAKVWFIRPMRSRTSTSLTDGGDTIYKQKGGIESTATSSVTGKKTADTRWEGTFEVRVTVRKGKRVLDRCRLTGVTWSVERQS